MSLRVVFLSLIASAAALAQSGGDEWSTFPPTPPAEETKPAPKAEPAAPAPASLPAPTPAVAPAPTPKQAAPAPAKAIEEAFVDKPASDEATVVSSQERYLPGSEPHSPATWSNSLDASTNLRVTTGVNGIGLLHVGSADLGRPGLVRMSAVGEYLSQRHFPVMNATNVRSSGTFAVSYVALEWLEAYLGYSASANSNTHSSPSLIQALGDLTFGAKGSREWTEGLHAGLDVRLMTYSGVGNQSVERWSVGFWPRAVATYDIRQLWPRVPIRVHGNLGFNLDSTGSMVSTHRLNASEEFALGVNEYNRFTLGLAAEAPLPYATPFIEYNLGVPLGVAAGALVGPDGVNVTAGEAMAQTFGLGVKVTAIKDLTLMAAVDFGLSRKVGLGIPATPPFNFLFGASFAVDPFQRGETKLVELVRERKIEAPAPPKTAKVTGRVIDAKTKKPLPGVVVAMVGAGLPPVASDAESGQFLTHELPGGPVKLSASKEGYKEATQELVLEQGQTATVELALEAEVRKANFDVTVVSKKKPLTATVAFLGPVNHQSGTSEASAEPVRVELAAGKYVVNVTADGYLAQTREVQTVEGAQMPLAFDLVPEPKKKLVVVKENRIEILQQVHFATGKATIMADSFSLLQQVVDAIVKHNIKRIRVEGHTDNRGRKAKNQKLSEDRAASVTDFLVNQGIDRGRIESAGFGDGRPIAPNLTARGRELNRRVEFVILER